jgi:nucleoside-diphosphate-sugar epimerase
MSETLHVIFGTGPVGCWTARSLRALDIPVRAVNRTGHRPELMPDDVEIAAADASSPMEAITVAQGAAVIYQALNPPYHRWHQLFPALQTAVVASAIDTGARYVSIENLYMYDASTTMCEESPIVPRSRKGKLRARMAEEVMAAHRKGDIRATALRSSDYYGPGVLDSSFGDRVIGSLVTGRKAQVVGSAGLPHSFAYIEDVGRAAATLGTHENANGNIWIAPHAPARTQGEMVEMACRVLATGPRIAVVSPMMMRLAGLFVPGARASVEMMYEFTQPFVVDSARFQQTYVVEPTPLETGIERTVEWYRKQVGRD